MVGSMVWVEGLLGLGAKRNELERKGVVVRERTLEIVAR